jgi:hypothetical protein
MDAIETMLARMTVADLAKLAGRSVADVIGFLLGDAPRRAPRATSKPTARAPRTVARGGIAPESVLEIVRAAREPVKAEHVRAQLGGSAAQVRTALQKLAAARKVKITGQRRGTRYQAR